jgi:hypothetical protein
MDDLDRLAFRVARTVRTTYPHLLEHGFTLSDLEERLAPYPEARREMASAGPDGYEMTVLRLLAGERGYLAAEPDLQEACRRALQMASPTVSIVRTWAGSTLSLRRPAFAIGSERGTGSGGLGSSASSRIIARDDRSASPDAPRGSSSTGDGAGYGSGTGVSERAADAPLGRSQAGCGCHFCGGTLPSGRALRFCPYCGLDLTVRHCPACSTELERNWRFCVTCGRQADDAERALGELPADTADDGTPLALAGEAVPFARSGERDPSIRNTP